ncbi:MAG: hypothetical protein MH204_01415 [Fimbriimonadaceae bacterium]|nr:hypothetical protein [Fimbriimonadaceae bacterium]
MVLLQFRPMGFSVELGAAEARVEPGAAAYGTITIQNTGSEPCELELVVEGLDLEWVALPNSTFRLEPGETKVERWKLSPPRRPDSTSGSYPYVVLVRDLETGESRASSAVLEVEPYHSLSLDFQPRRVQVSSFQTGHVVVTVTNLGNEEQVLQVTATDQENQLVFDLEQDQVVLQPGAQKNLRVGVRAAGSPILAGARLCAFTVTARSQENAGLGTQTQGVVELRAVLSPVTAVVGMVIIGLFLLWLVMLPKKPSVLSFTVDPEKVIAGESVRVIWRTKDSDRIRLKLGAQDWKDFPAEGSHSVTADLPGRMEISLVALRGDEETAVSTRIVEVRPIPKAPPPTIEEFKVSSRSIRLGEGVIFSYRLGPSVTAATLEPFAATIDPRSTSLQVTPTAGGTIRARLIARNADGMSVEQSINLEVRDESLARIVEFSAAPRELEPGGGTVQVSWVLEEAYRATLEVDGRLISLDALRGRVEIPVTTASKFVLTAYDRNDKAVSRTIEVTIKQPPAPEPDRPGPADPADPTGVTPATPEGRPVPEPVSP